jgi:hypothetical protein
MRMLLVAHILIVSGLLVGCEPAPQTATLATSPAVPPTPPPPPSATATAGSAAANSNADKAAQIDPGVAGDLATAAVPLGAKAFLQASAEFSKTLGGITDGPSANAAAPQMKIQTAKIKATLPAFKLFMATAPKEQVLLVLQQQAADQMAHEPSVDLTELARQPGNEAFREAYIGFFVVMRDDGTSGTRRSAERELAKLMQ